MTRNARVERRTKETQIAIALGLDGTGKRQIKTPVPFLDHMLDAFGKHGAFDLEVEAAGDVEVDAHHTVEDVGLVLGEALTRALGDKTGIARFGEAKVPMDETLAEVVLDLSGRPAFVWHAPGLDGKWVGTFDCMLGKEFFAAICQTGKMNLHMRIAYGENAHHMLEALWKAFARALRVAVAIDPRSHGVPSTKGTLTD